MDSSGIYVSFPESDLVSEQLWLMDWVALLATHIHRPSPGWYVLTWSFRSPAIYLSCFNWAHPTFWWSSSYCLFFYLSQHYGFLMEVGLYRIYPKYDNLSCVICVLSENSGLIYFMIHVFIYLAVHGNLKRLIQQ